MSDASGDLFDVSAYLRKGPHQHPATEPHFVVENDGEGHWRYARKRARAQLCASKAAGCLTVGILANLLLAMPLTTTELVAPARAQARRHRRCTETAKEHL